VLNNKNKDEENVFLYKKPEKDRKGTQMLIPREYQLRYQRNINCDAKGVSLMTPGKCQRWCKYNKTSNM